MDDKKKYDFIFEDGKIHIYRNKKICDSNWKKPSAESKY